MRRRSLFGTGNSLRGRKPPAMLGAQFGHVFGIPNAPVPVDKTVEIGTD
jgi:hypothetical protein